MALSTTTLATALTTIFGANNYTNSTSGIANKKIPVTESNGLPSGQIGMAALASVLLNPNNNDFNALGLSIDSTDIPFGFYSLLNYESNGSGLPYTPDTTSRGILINFPTYAANKRAQLILLLGASKIYGRYKSGTGSWTAWKSVTFT